MKKILFVVNNFNIGGPQKSLLALLDNINYDIFEISLISLEPNGTLIKYLNKNVTVIQVSDLITALTIPAKRTLYYLKIIFLNSKIIALFDFLLILIRYIFNRDMNPRRQRFWKKHSKELPILDDHFDAAFGVSSGLSTYFVVDCINSAKKYHWVRGDYSRISIDKEVDEFYFRQVDGSLAVGKKCADIFTNIFPFMERRIKVFYNILPIKFYKRVEDQAEDIREDGYLKLLTVTRLDRFKGLDLAVETCNKLIKRGVKFKWYILGDGLYRKEIERIIETNKIANYMILLGFKLNTFAYINRCDIFVHPSRSEGKSNVVDEALYLNKPIVVTNYDTVNEQITDNVNGFICSMSSDAITDKIGYVIRHLDTIKNKTTYEIGYDYDKDPTEFFLQLC